MTLESTILESLARWKPDGEKPHALAIPVSDGSVHLTANRCDDLAAQLWSLTVQVGSARAVSEAELSDRAAATARRVVGLLEPLRVYEVDPTASRALLRSATPEVRDGATSFYELLLTGLHSAELKRYRVDGRRPGRVAVPYTLTHEVIGRVVDVLAG